MHEAFASTPLKLYAICSAVLGLHLVALALWTGTIRALRRVYVNPEDATLNHAARADADHDDVQRVKRAHMNALENFLPFLAVGLLYATTHGASTVGASVYFVTFTAVRLLHSVFYMAGKQPWRTITFAIGAGAIIGMGVQAIAALV